MNFCDRMRTSMLVVIVLCLMCVTSALGREEEAARADAGQEQEGMYMTCETR